MIHLLAARRSSSSIRRVLAQHLALPKRENRVISPVVRGMTMTKHGVELAQAGRMFIERSVRASAPSCVVLIVGAGAASFVEQELAALVSGGGCLSPEAARRAAVLAWPLEGALGHDGGDVCEPTVRPLSDGALLEASSRYWVPPRSRVWLEGARVRLAPLGPGDDHPLDALLMSLAHGWGPRSIAVLPMTPGADGERGVGALRVAGGLALPCSDEPDELVPHSGARLRRQSN
jgi:hypothetical protein